MQKDTRKKDRAYKATMLLKYWKATNRDPIMDLCMIIAMYAQDIEAGLLYAVGWKTTLTARSGYFKNINTLSRIILQDKHGENALVKGIMNGSWELHTFLFENGRVRVIERNGSTFDIPSESKIIKMNSGNYCHSLFVIDAKMRAYEIKDKTPVRITGLPNAIKIKDISSGYKFTVFLSECGQVLGMGLNDRGNLGLSRRIEKTEIPTEITFPNQSGLDKNRIVITMIYASGFGWVAVDSRQRAWVIGEKLMQCVRSNYKFLDPCIGIVEVWHSNKIRITQIKCGRRHVIALDTKRRVYWFGKYEEEMALSHVSSDSIPFSHRIVEVRSGHNSVACKDATNEWYAWGFNSFSHITGLCGCEAVCKKTRSGAIISNPMRCEWQGLFNATRVINLQLGRYKAHVIVGTV